MPHATVIVAGHGASAAHSLEAWFAATQGQPRAVFVEGLQLPPLPDDVPVTPLAAGCVCCLGQVPLRVGLTRALRNTRPQALLLVLSTGDHLPRVRALLADGSLGVRFELDGDEDGDDEHRDATAAEKPR